MDTTATYFVICISTQASQLTIFWYVKLFLGMCGIDITIFAALSTQSASTSTANNIGLSIKNIQKAAGWSGDSTCRKHYNLPFQKNFGSEIVNRFKNNWKTWTCVELLLILVYYIFWHNIVYKKIISGFQISLEYVRIVGNFIISQLNKWNAV